MFDMQGFDQFRHRLRKLEDNLADLAGEHSVPANELFSADFMRRHSKYASFDAMVQASPFEVASAEDLEAIPDDEWDAFVRSSTQFDSWEQMMGRASEEWMHRRLGQDGVTDGADLSPADNQHERPEVSETPTAFLIHSSEDHQFVRRLAHDLMANGVEVFYDEWEIRAGDSLVRKIDQGIEGCDVFIPVLSPASLESPWVREELSAAIIKRIEEHARIIPVMLEKCQAPPLISHLVRTTFDDYDKGLAKVLDGIFRPPLRPALGPAPQVAEHEPAQVPGLTPDDEAVLVYVVQHSVDSTTAMFQGHVLAEDLGMTAEQVNESVAILKDQWYLESHDWMGRSPYDFGAVYATVHAFRAVRHVLEYDPDDDVRVVGAAIVSLESGDGPGLQEVTCLTPARISRAVRYLEYEGLVEPVRTIGTAPFDFRRVEATPRLRRYVARYQAR